MPTGPYRTRPRPERPPGAPSTLSETVMVGVFIWLVTLVRVVASLVRSEPPGREVVFAWIVLLVVPLAIRREIARRGGRGGAD